jgi:hypothetical protein
MGQKALWGELSEEQVGCKKMALTNVCHSSHTRGHRQEKVAKWAFLFGLIWFKMGET